MSQSYVPSWTALTAYLPYARVTPVTPNGLNWWTTGGGTSGAAEPTWPTADPWTVVDGSVTWQLASSWRQQVSAGILALVTAFRDANPTLLKGIATARPKSFTSLDLPGVFIDGGDEVIPYTPGIRQRDISTTVTAVTYVPDNAEAQTGMDALLDGLIDLFTSGYHAANGYGIVQANSIRQIPVPDGPVAYLGYEFTFGNTVGQGRT